MRIVRKYSHLNGWEYMHTHKPALWQEIESVISSVDADSCKTKVSQERTMMGKLLYAPQAMNSALAKGFQKLDWQSRKQPLWVTEDESVTRAIIRLTEEEQKKFIEKNNLTPIYSYNQTDYIKERIAVEVQFGKYAFVAHDLFVKHMAFYVGDIIDVGVEILPMKSLERNMSSGVPYYERDLFNILRQGRGIPAVPLVLLGIAQ